jgi:hypothetical protein
MKMCNETIAAADTVMADFEEKKFLKAIEDSVSFLNIT